MYFERKQEWNDCWYPKVQPINQTVVNIMVWPNSYFVETEQMDYI